MDAQRPRLHFVQLNPDQMPDEVETERGLRYLFPLPMFCRGSRELHMGRELGDAGPATVGFFSGTVTPEPSPGFSSPASPT